ncbi:MAG: dihydroorotate dehydrogenase electron transfer subunit [Bacteroidales bacterium]|nr:dihydroorotate dehydrogenase electron transfer subunit [Bacteroidales bacterium]
MEQRLFKIVANKEIAELTYRLDLEAVEPGFSFDGEFVNIKIDGFFLRRPISVCDSYPGGITLVYKVVGKGTEALSHKKEGEVLDLLTGLGRGFDAAATESSALLVAGGLGAAPLLPLAKKLKAAGKKVNVVLGFNKASEICLEEELRALADSFEIATVDAIKAMDPTFDYFYTCGPMVMMKVVCKTLDAPGEASLEERMGCGFGICVGCTVVTKNGPRKVCKDGPVFKKEDIVW